MSDDAPQVKIAIEIAKMLKLREAGVLRKSVDDFISGLIKAYALIVNESNVTIAYNRATREASTLQQRVDLEVARYTEETKA